MDLKRYPYRARAWRGDRLLADSHSTIRQDRLDQHALLWFPVVDVHSELLGDVLPTLPHGEGQLAGFVCLQVDGVRIEVFDAGIGDTDVSMKRFPNWGDAADLIDMMDVRPTEVDGRYISVARSDWRRPVVEGSQMLGQAIVAAMRQTGGRRVASASMVFTRIADSRQPLTFVLESLTHGRTFSTITVRVEQNHRLCAFGTLLLDATAADVIRHSVGRPDVPGPDGCPPFDMGVTGRDIRIADAAYTSDPDAPVGPPVIDSWVRFRDVPDEPALHAGLLAQFTGHLSLAAAMRPHAGVGETQAHVTLSTGINAITISFHRDVRVDDWVLYHHLSTSASDGMTHSECRVHDVDGDLLASFTVDAMVRHFASSAIGDFRRSM